LKQISGPKLNWDNGAQNEGDPEDRRMGNMMWMLGNINVNRAREDNTPEKIEKFKGSLIKRMEETYNRAVEHYPDYHLSFGVDYHPDEILFESAQEAGIDDTVFPCKTYMWVDSKKVSAKCGYGSQEKIIAEL
jgi:hypothetical protein